ncbi:MAG TPA: ATP-binding cassette domain-containing protein, partial [Lysobacter sp.]|nr:ATP-binding cassette domain-containing protein [Lysobacter sp.]
MTDATPIVRIDNLRLDRGGRTVLRDISLTVPRGSIVAVLGPSGSGKSTLLAALTGELHAAAGKVEVLGQEVPRSQRALLEL